MFIWIFVHLRNPINVRQIELLVVCLYSEGSEDWFVVVQHFWCRKIRQIVCRIPGEWMGSKFLDQDIDVVFLANKCIVIAGFVGRSYNKILMETGKFMDNIRVTKNGLVSGVDRMFKSSDSALNHIPNRLNIFQLRLTEFISVEKRNFCLHKWFFVRKEFNNSQDVFEILILLP